MKNLVFFLEGQSEKEMLKGLLPHLLPEHIRPRYIIFNGKGDLIKNLCHRLKEWCLPDSGFIILVDQDKNDCKKLKKNLQKLCTQIRPQRPFIIRLACRELESWYFGDLSSTADALGIPRLTELTNKKAYRNPDAIKYPAKELSNITKGRYQKISGSRAMGKYLKIDENRSRSFRVFIKGIQKLIAT